MIFKLLKWAVSLVLIAIIIGAAALSVFTFKGYKMYEEAVKEKPMEQMAEEIMSREDFTEYEELPEIYKSAVISAEDKRFFSHCGVDLISIGRALWNDLKAGAFVEGGSTISQQLMKNQYFTQEKKLERKFAEIFAALELEKKYEKEEIFEMYVSTIYFGSGYYGIAEAAKGYYGKTPEELSDSEAIMLAGLPNAPSAYSLDSSPELAKQRMRQVLDKMLECETISPEEAESVFAEN